jgi:hypothetical protein
LWLWRDSSDAIAEKRDRQVYDCVALLTSSMAITSVFDFGVEVSPSVRPVTVGFGAEQSGHRALFSMRTMKSSVHLSLRESVQPEKL